MSQEQPQRPKEAQQGPQEAQQQAQTDPVKYGDVFPFSGDLAKEPIAPQDAVVMQTAEAAVFGGMQPGGVAEVMGRAAVVNQRIGGVEQDTISDGGKDVTVTTTDYPVGRVVTESVSGQVVGQYFQAAQVQHPAGAVAGAVAHSHITIGEALEVAARVCGDKIVDRSDAAAIQEAEAIVTGSMEMTPGGVAATAVSAASFNAGDATLKLPGDKVVTREISDRVASAEMRNNPTLTANVAGVAASVATASGLNEGGT